MEFNDVLGLGKVLPLDKLLDVLQKGLGRITKAYFERRDIDTKVYEIQQLTQARAEAIQTIAKSIKESNLPSDIEYKENEIIITSKNDMRLLPNLSLEERTSERTSFQEAKCQLNIENVVSFAAEELQKEESVTDEEIDEEWLNRFFRIIEDISSEDMQALWGKILAGEIKQPKSFSLRTLDVIKNITKEEAEVFNRLAKFAITSDGKSYFLFKGKQVFIVGNNNVKSSVYDFADISLMTEVGIIQPKDFVSKQFKDIAEGSQFPFIFGDKVLIVKSNSTQSNLTLEVDLFTQVGNDLLKLVDKNPSDEYLNLFIKAFDSTRNCFKIGKLKSLNPPAISYEDLKEFVVE